MPVRAFLFCLKHLIIHFVYNLDIPINRGDNNMKIFFNLVNFVAINWTGFLSTLSLIISLSVAFDSWLSRRTHLEEKELLTVMVTPSYLYVFVTLTNKSSQPISIINASLSDVPLYRHIHKFTSNDKDPLANRNTSSFPFHFGPEDTKSVLMEFDKQAGDPWNKEEKLTLKIITSKKPIELTFSINQKLAPIGLALRVI